jgi:predicted TIM-barrel fold metal-dependent hydrolase
MSNLPRRAAPANSCDCHIHVFDHRFASPAGDVPSKRTASDYRVAQQRIGTTRTVVVTPRPYVTDSRCTLDAISQLGAAVTRGIAVLHPTVTDAELKQLADGGIRGIRFTVGNPSVAVTTVDMIEPLAKRINGLGWHVQLNMRGDQIVANADLLERLECPIVFDHMARLPQPEGIRHAAFQVVRRLLDKGRAWVKLTSVVYADSEAALIGDVARAFIRAAPERMLWGSDWPHGNKQEMPDDRILFDRLAEWAGDVPTWHRILVDNPQMLYGFSETG